MISLLFACKWLWDEFVLRRAFRRAVVRTTETDRLQTGSLPSRPTLCKPVRTDHIDLLTSRQVHGTYTRNREEGDTPRVRPPLIKRRSPSAKEQGGISAKKGDDACNGRRHATTVALQYSLDLYSSVPPRHY